MGAVSVFTNSMASATSIVTFDVGGSWERMFLLVKTFPSQTTLNIQVAIASNATYYPLAMEVPVTTTVQCWPYQIAPTATSAGFVIPLPNFNFRYFRIQANSLPTTAIDFSVICSGNLG